MADCRLGFIGRNRIRRLCLKYDSGRNHFINCGVFQSGAAADLTGVRTQFPRSGAYCSGSARELNWNAQCLVVGVLDDHGSMGRVRGGQCLTNVENGTRRDTAAEQTGTQFFCVLIDKDGLKKIMQLLPVLYPQGVRLETGINRQIRASQKCTADEN